MSGDRTPPGPPPDAGALADDVAAVQRPVVESAARLRQARNRLLLSTAAHGLREPRARRGLLWIPPVLAAAAAVTFALAWNREEPLTFGTGTGAMRAALGAPLLAPDDAPLPLRFSDGSAFTAAPRSRLTVTEVAADGAGVVLNEGALAAAVVHRARSRWRVQAGPYTVAVTGTRFAVEWHPGSRSFVLTLHEGGVTVFGPSLGTGGRRVTPHETVRLGPAPSGSPPSPPPSPSSPAMDAAFASAERGRAVALSQSQAPGRSTWKGLAQAGRYADALAAAEGDGFAQLCRRAPVADLLLLGNTARFAQQPQRAEQAFRATRARGGASHESAVAAFELGRLAHDVGRRYRDSADWFAVYLREEPGGALAHEASGRRMEALHRAGDVRAATGAAEVYLRRHPDGAYQGLARELLRM